MSKLTYTHTVEENGKTYDIVLEIPFTWVPYRAATFHNPPEGGYAELEIENGIAVQCNDTMLPPAAGKILGKFYLDQINIEKIHDSAVAQAEMDEQAAKDRVVDFAIDQALGK